MAKLSNPVPSNASGATENSPAQSWDNAQLASQQAQYNQSQSEQAATIAANTRAKNARSTATPATGSNGAPVMPPFSLNKHGTPALRGKSSNPAPGKGKRGK